MRDTQVDTLGQTLGTAYPTLSVLPVPRIGQIDPEMSLISYLIACMIFVLKNSQGEIKNVVVNVKNTKFKQRKSVLPLGWY